jgi:hypothetical protein
MPTFAYLRKCLFFPIFISIPIVQYVILHVFIPDCSSSTTPGDVPLPSLGALCVTIRCCVSTRQPVSRVTPHACTTISAIHDRAQGNRAAARVVDFLIFCICELELERCTTVVA